MTCSDSRTSHGNTGQNTPRAASSDANMIHVRPGVGFSSANGHDASGVGNKLGKTGEVQVQVCQRVGLAVVNQDDQTERAARQDGPHEVKPLLARRAIKPQLVTVVQCQFTVVQPHGGHALADTGVCVAHIRAERRNFADGCNGRGFSGACHAREEYFVFVQVMYWVKC